MFTPVTTIQDPAARGFADHAQRRWGQGRLDAIWISDITYLPTGEGWLYLAAVRDGHSRRVLGWAMDECQNAGLVDRALRMAHTLRGTVPDDLGFHADRGVQHTPQRMFETCEELGIRQPMGRTGVSWDNAMAESFWATLKTEFYDRRSWPSRAEARREVARWIEIVFNRRRLHSSLDYTSPVTFENALDRHQAETEEHQDQAQAARSTVNDLRASPTPANQECCFDATTPPPPKTRGGRASASRPFHPTPSCKSNRTTSAPRLK